MRNKISRIAVTGAAASMAFATAAPALACQTSEPSETKTVSQQATLAQQKAWLEAFVARGQQQLAALADKVAANSQLTSAQQSAWASWIAAQQAKLAALKSAVEAATTVGALHQAVHSVLAGSGWFGWYGAFSAERERIASELWSMAKAQQRHPAHASTIKRPGVTTVVLRNRAGSRQLPAGQHRSDDAGSWQGDRDYQARHDFGDHHRRGSDHDSWRSWDRHRR